MNHSTRPHKPEQKQDWDFDSLRRSYDAISDIALGELKLDLYPNQIEVITFEQMLHDDADAGHLPCLFRP